MGGCSSAPSQQQRNRMVFGRYYTSTDWDNRIVKWMGLHWGLQDSRYSMIGPGPNFYFPSNVTIQNDGNLHMKIRYLDGRWSCASIKSMQAFSYGIYTFGIIADTSFLDPNVVLSMFIGPKTITPLSQGSNQINISLSKWGNNMPSTFSTYTVFPELIYGRKSTPISEIQNFPTRSQFSVHRIRWTPKSIVLMSQQGNEFDQSRPFNIWKCPDLAENANPDPPLGIHFTYWLNKSPQEMYSTSESQIVIRFFNFEPLFKQ